MDKNSALAAIAAKNSLIKAMQEDIQSLKKVAMPGLLTDATREEVATFIVEYSLDTTFGDGLESEYLWDGCVIVGVTELTDEELVEELLNCTDEEDDLYQKAKGELILEAVLAGESIDE